MGKAIGVIEYSSIGKGIESLDAMLKCADVCVIDSRMVCVGKYFVVITGEVAAVTNSLKAGVECAGTYVIGSKVVPSVAEGVLEKINASIEKDKIRALGILETKDLAYGVYGANAIKKSSSVDLLKVSMQLGLGGKCIVLFTGDVASVQNALEVAKEKIGDSKRVISAVAIPSPAPDLVKSL
tara:strand:- start:110 stop:655 length:546 start_codon:yes stop_codon:yes gene_type:complete